MVFAWSRCYTSNLLGARACELVDTTTNQASRPRCDYHLGSVSSISNWCNSVLMVNTT